jgi:hypothetical protein
VQSIPYTSTPHVDSEGIPEGEYKEQASASRALGVTRMRITQLLNLTFLAPDIQEEILFLEAVDGREPLTERAIREILRNDDWTAQRMAWSSASAVRASATATE